MNPAPTLDLDAYLARIDYRGRLAPDARTLADLHFAHSTHIPFENLDVLLGNIPRLDLESLQAKLVAPAAGGTASSRTCSSRPFWKSSGSRSPRLAARVWSRTTHRLPRTHMLLWVDLPGGPVLADVGFGGEGLFPPVPLIDGHEMPQFAWGYRSSAGPHWMLQPRRPDGYADLYEFSEEPQHPVDYEPGNHFVATHPSSPFPRTLIVSTPTPGPGSSSAAATSAPTAAARTSRPAPWARTNCPRCWSKPSA